jgi:hypothetical protein
MEEGAFRICSECRGFGVTRGHIVGEDLFEGGQLPWCCPSIVVRAVASPASLESSVRSVVSSMDRQLPLSDVRTGDEIRSLGVMPATFPMLLPASLAAIGLLLTSVGVYGVLSYAVVTRTREIGIRMAVGASASAVVSMMLRRTTILVAAGLVVGIADRSPPAGSCLRSSSASTRETRCSSWPQCR